MFNMPKQPGNLTTQTLNFLLAVLRLLVIIHKAIPARPGRSEARVRKRRPKAYPLVTKSWHEGSKQLQTA